MRRGALSICVAALVVFGALIYRSTTASTDAPASGRERMAAAVQAFFVADNRMRPEEVRQTFGEPDSVFRNNPRALCWAYESPYEIRMCWGPKRRQAWLAHNIPPHERLSANR